VLVWLNAHCSSRALSLIYRCSSLQARANLGTIWEGAAPGVERNYGGPAPLEEGEYHGDAAPKARNIP
jgi:hypothetical protein